MESVMIVVKYQVHMQMQSAKENRAPGSTPWQPSETETQHQTDKEK